MAVADHMRSELVLDALDMAVSERGGDVTGTIMHSDKGTQYTAGIMKQACERYGLRRSMGETGNAGTMLARKLMVDVQARVLPPSHFHPGRRIDCCG